MCSPYAMHFLDRDTPSLLITINIFISTIWARWVVFMPCASLPPSLTPPSFATPAVPQPERRNVRLDGCSSGNVPFQSAFAPEISSLIPLRPIPAKTGIWWEGNGGGGLMVREWNTVGLIRWGRVGQTERSGGGGQQRVGVNSHSSSLHGVEMILLTPWL